MKDGRYKQSIRQIEIDVMFAPTDTSRGRARVDQGSRASVATAQRRLLLGIACSGLQNVTQKFSYASMNFDPEQVIPTVKPKVECLISDSTSSVSSTSSPDRIFRRLDFPDIDERITADPKCSTTQRLCTGN